MFENNTIIFKEIEKLNYAIEHVSSKSKKRELIISLNSIVELCNEVNNTEYSCNCINAENLNFVLKEIHNILFEHYKTVSTDAYINNINILCNNSLDKLENYNHPLHINPKFNLNDSKGLIIDFFNSFDKSLEKYIIEMIDKYTFAVINKKEDSSGYIIQNIRSKNNYILIRVSDNKKLSVENLSCLVHELGHAVHFKAIIDRHNLCSNVIYNNFIEFPSSIFELFFLKYLKSNKINIMDTEKTMYNYLNYIKKYIECLNFTNSIIKYISPDTEYNIEDINKILIDNNLEFSLNVDQMYNSLNDIQGNYFYSINGLLSYYFYEKYILDKETVKKDIYNIIKCIGVEPDSYMFNYLGINLDEFLKCEYLDNTINENLKTLKI